MSVAQEDLAPVPSRRGRGIPYFRWVIGVLLFFAAILNYTDRQALSILKPTISGAINMSDDDYAHVNMMFFIAYTISNLFSGRLVDLWGPRVSMVAFVGWWSVSNIITSLSRGAASLGLCRFSLGLGEAGNWPASTKVVSEWFPARERASAVGFYTLGATLGATIAPWIVIKLAHQQWQFAFIATGAMGLIWIPLWALIYRAPAEHRLITQNDLDVLQAQARDDARRNSADEKQAGRSEWRRWSMALSVKAVWALMIARLLTDCVWYFYQQWYASYLSSDRGMSQEGLAITGMLFFAADIGSLLGGFVSFMLARSNRSARASRIMTMFGCATLMLLSPLVCRVETTRLSLLLACVIALAHMAWLVNITALTVDVVPRHLLATCFGITAAGSSLGGMMMNGFVAHFAKAHQYQQWFWIMALLHPLAWVILVALRLHRQEPDVEINR